MTATAQMWTSSSRLRGIVAVEVKAAVVPAGHHFKHLKTLRDKLGDEFIAGIVLTTGEGNQLGDRLETLPVSSFWTHGD